VSAAVGPGSASPFHWNEEVRPGLRVAFTSVSAGNLALHVGNEADAVLDNRRRLEASMGVPSSSLRFMSQTHSARVTVIGDAEPRDAVPDADGMVSPSGSEPLAVLVADCVPIVLADTREDRGAGATAVVHAGRAGIGNGIIAEAVLTLQRQGAQELTAWLGPAVCGSCYEVPEDMMLGIAREVPAAASRTPRGTPALDLPAAARQQLLRAGVHVEPEPAALSWCTAEHTTLFSHRRAPGLGRIAGLVWRT
jgi:YfiH family protein